MILDNGEVLFGWPLAKHILTAGWTYSDGSSHGAIDFRASVGTPVFSADDGTVNWVQSWDGRTKTGNQSYGNLIRIKHKNYKNEKLETYYAHLSTILVSSGQSVKEGQLIGYSGQTGNCYGAHLHFEVRLDGSRVNPLNWLNNDFSCANSSVKSHLGTYTSVKVPESSDKKEETKPVNQLQRICIIGASDEIKKKAKSLGLKTQDVTATLFDPASNGDAMTLWGMAQSAKEEYFSRFTNLN